MNEKEVDGELRRVDHKGYKKCEIGRGPERENDGRSFRNGELDILRRGDERGMWGGKRDGRGLTGSLHALKR